MANTWNSGINDRKVKEQICEIGRRVYAKGFAAANDGNISYRVGRTVNFDPKTMMITGDKEAAAMMTRDYRKPFVVPEKV